jgi:di/tricarboxylate transporter
MRTVAIIVLAIGIIMTVFTGFTLVTKKKVVDVGPIEVNKEEKTPIYWSPITGLVLTGFGVILLVAAKGKKA